MLGNVRQPQQQRSIEKRNRIIQAAFKLFCENGYYHTSTTDIAKEAGVSIGVIYNYFADKKAIYLEVYVLYASTITRPVHEKLKTAQPPFSLFELVEFVLDATAAAHNIPEQAHDEMLMMGYADKDAAAIYYQFDTDLVNVIIDFFSGIGVEIPDAFEKVHVIRELLDFYCHEVVYHKHVGMDSHVLKKTITNVIVSILSDGTQVKELYIATKTSAN